MAHRCFRSLLLLLLLSLLPTCGSKFLSGSFPISFGAIPQCALELLPTCGSKFLSGSFPTLLLWRSFLSPLVPAWDPSLMFVMCSALAITMPTFQYLKRRQGLSCNCFPACRSCFPA